MITYLTVAQFADARGISRRQVQRYLSPECRIPGAEKGPRGWRIPADAMIPSDDPTGAVVVRQRGAAPTVVPGGVQGVGPGPFHAGPRPSPLGVLVPLDVASAVLGTTVGGVLRMADDGHLTVGRYGPRGTRMVYLPGGAR